MSPSEALRRSLLHPSLLQRGVDLLRLFVNSPPVVRRALCSQLPALNRAGSIRRQQPRSRQRPPRAQAEARSSSGYPSEQRAPNKRSGWDQSEMGSHREGSPRNPQHRRLPCAGQASQARHAQSHQRKGFADHLTDDSKANGLHDDDKHHHLSSGGCREV